MYRLPTFVQLTPARKRLLDLLSDGKWHRKFLGIGINTFDLMEELGFIRMRHIDKKPWKTDNWTVEARITMKGRFLLKNKSATMDYSQRNVQNMSNPNSIKVVEMQA